MNSNLSSRESKLPQGLAEKNVESWKKVVVFFREFASKENWEFLESMHELTEIMVKGENARLFRAGQSLYYLLISTAEKHGLESDEPFVSVQLEKNKLWLIQYYESLGKSTQSQTCSNNNEVLDVLQIFLDRLWLATRE